MPVIPWMAILAATAASFFVGALWYSPALFGRVWRREAGLDEQTLGRSSKFRLYGTTFVLTLISTSFLSFCLSPGPGVFYGAMAGLVIGVGWVATSIGTNFLFEGKSLAHFLITAGYHVIRFLIAGTVLGFLQ
jgi:hypothetical protein